MLALVPSALPICMVPRRPFPHECSELQHFGTQAAGLRTRLVAAGSRRLHGRRRHPDPRPDPARFHGTATPPTVDSFCLRNSHTSIRRCRVAPEHADRPVRGVRTLRRFPCPIKSADIPKTPVEAPLPAGFACSVSENPSHPRFPTRSPFRRSVPRRTRSAADAATRIAIRGPHENPAIRGVRAAGGR